MANLIEITPIRTYATRANAIKAFEKRYGTDYSIRYAVLRTEDGRYFPVALGTSAVSAGVHFHFNVLG